MYKFELMAAIVLTKVVFRGVVKLCNNISTQKAKTILGTKVLHKLCTYFVFIVYPLSPCLFEMVFILINRGN